MSVFCHLKTFLNDLDHDLLSYCQSGFLCGRYIGNNIRLILDLIDYNFLLTDDNYILFIDYYKAFDTVHFYLKFLISLVLATTLSMQFEHYIMIAIALLNYPSAPLPDLI